MAELLQIFYEPRKAFEQIRERRLFWPALIMLAIFGLILGLVVMNKIGLENVMRQQLEQRSGTTPEAMQRGLQMASAPWYKYMNMAIYFLSGPLVATITAAVLLGVFAMTGKRAAFSQMLGTVSYSMVPFMLLAVIAGSVLLMVVADPETRDPQTLVAFNAGAFMDKANTGKALYALLGSLDLLSIGQVLLMSYGTSIVTKSKWSSNIVIVGGLWLLYVIGKVGIAAIRG